MNTKRILLLSAVCLTPAVSALAAGDVLMVVANPTTPSANDAAMKARLEAFGFNVVLKEASASQTSDANGKVLVLTSASVNSGNVSTKFRDVAVPILNTERALQDEYLMTLNEPTGHGQTPLGQVDIVITDSSNPLAAGLGPGVVTVTTTPTPFTWGVPNENAQVVATLNDGSGHPCIYGYTNGAVLIDGVTHAPARRVELYQADEGLSLANSNGVALFDAAVAWALNVPSLGTPPTVTLTQPANGATFAAGANINLEAAATDAETSVTRVEFYAGTTKLGEVTSGTGTFAFTWTNAPTGRYNLSAKAFDTSGASGISSPVTVIVGTPPPQVVMVVGDPNALTSGEAGLEARLASFGYGVVLVDDNQSSTNDAIGTALILISSTVNSGTVGTTYQQVTVPIINWENGLQDDLLMTGPLPNVDFGFADGQTEIYVHAGHPLAGGLSEGVHQVTTSPSTFAWGYPQNMFGTPTIVAELNDGSGLPCIYAYDAGALLANGSTPAPARRVQLFLSDDTFSLLTSDGVKLVDAALAWALNTTLGTPPTVSLTQPASGATFAAGSDIMLSADANDSDGTVTNVQFLVDGSLVGQDATSPYSVTWSNVPAGIYRITAKATDNNGYAADSAATTIVVGQPTPHILFVVGNATAPNISDQKMKSHLESAGYVVTVVGDAASAASDAVGHKLVIISGSVASGNVGDKFRDIALPVINMEHELDDNFLMTDTNHAEVYGQTSIDITDEAHPLAGGLTNGTYTVATTPDRIFIWGVPAADAAIVATTSDTNHYPCIFGYDKGDLLIDGTTPAPERRVHFFVGDNTYTVMNATGVRLFDAAVKWALPMPPKFNPIVAELGNITVSWVGFGTLQSAQSLLGPWVAVPNPANPFTTNMTGSALFFRIQQ